MNISNSIHSYRNQWLLCCLSGCCKKCCSIDLQLVWETVAVRVICEPLNLRATLLPQKKINMQVNLIRLTSFYMPHTQNVLAKYHVCAQNMCEECEAKNEKKVKKKPKGETSWKSTCGALRVMPPFAIFQHLREIVFRLNYALLLYRKLHLSNRLLFIVLNLQILALLLTP